MKQTNDQCTLWSNNLNRDKSKAKLFNAYLRNSSDFVVIQNLIKARFKKTWIIKQKEQFLENKKQILVKDNWVIKGVFSSYETDEWKIIFQNMVQAFCKVLVINQRKQSLTYIRNINFASMHTLDLRRNNIENIEALSIIFFPRLKQLDLSYNNITSCKSLLKQNLQYVRGFNLCINFVKQFKIERLCLKKSKEEFFFQVSQKQEKHAIQDIRYIAKQQRGNNKRLLNSSIIISLQNIFEKIEERFVYDHKKALIQISERLFISLNEKFMAKQKQKKGEKSLKA